MITLKQLAQELNLSEATVSRVLNGKGDDFRISKQTQAIILEAADKHDFVPNVLARSLRLKKSETLGLIVPDVSNPFFAQIVKSVQQEAKQKEYQVILFDTDETLDQEIKAIQLMRQRNVDGLIVCPVGLSFEHLEKLNLPIIVLDRHAPDSSLPCVVSDNYQGALEAVRFLIRKGHRRIACIQGLQGASPNEFRIRGYRKALAEAGLSVKSEYLVGQGFREDNGYLETKMLMQLAQPPTAIFVVSNLICLGVLRALSEDGLKVPDDLSLISFDDQPYSPYLASPMTTVGQNPLDMGKISVKMLLNRIETGKPAQNVCLPTRLIIRESVRQY